MMGLALRLTAVRGRRAPGGGGEPGAPDDAITQLLATMASGEWKKVSSGIVSTANSGRIQEILLDRTVANWDARSGAPYFWGSDLATATTNIENALKRDEYAVGGFFAYSGACFDTLRKRFVVFGGGHGDGADNSLLAFDLEQACQNILDEAKPDGFTGGNNGGAWSLLQGGAPYDDTVADGYPYVELDQAPQTGSRFPQPQTASITPYAHHTYNTLQYDAANDRYIVGGAFPSDPIGLGDVGAIWGYDCATDLWSPLVEPAAGWNGNSGHFFRHTGQDDDAWMFARSTAVREITLDTFSDTTIESDGSFAQGEAIGCLLPTLESSGSGEDYVRMQFYSANWCVFPKIATAGASPYFVSSFTGDTRLFDYDRSGFAYRPVDGCIYAITAFSTTFRTVQKITPAERGSAWAIADFTTTGDTPSGNFTESVKGRFGYLEDYDCFWFIGDRNSSGVWLLKP